MIFALLRIGGVPPNILRGSWPWGGRYVDSPRGFGLNSDAVPSGYPPRKAIIDSLARGGGLRIPSSSRSHQDAARPALLVGSTTFPLGCTWRCRRLAGHERKFEQVHSQGGILV